MVRKEHVCESELCEMRGYENGRVELNRSMASRAVVLSFVKW
jgi:hypothetical protein